MPCHSWIHECPELGGSTYTVEPECQLCGEAGTSAGWQLGMHEAMARYQYLTGLAPVGPHRPLADELFTGTRTTCESCSGGGILTLSTDRWAVCATCEGTGGFWLISQAALEILREAVLARYPRAAAPRDIRFLGGVLIHDIANGIIIDGSRVPLVTTPRPRLRLQDIANAFARARSELGSTWRLKGRGHCRRVTLQSHVSRAAAQGASDCCQVFTPHGAQFPVRVFPLALVEHAAEILGVPVERLVSREFA